MPHFIIFNRHVHSVKARMCMVLNTQQDCCDMQQWMPKFSYVPYVCVSMHVPVCGGHVFMVACSRCSQEKYHFQVCYNNIYIYGVDIGVHLHCVSSIYCCHSVMHTTTWTFQRVGLFASPTFSVVIISFSCYPLCQLFHATVPFTILCFLFCSHAGVCLPVFCSVFFL